MNASFASGVRRGTVAHVVIVGAGFGGLAAARTLAKERVEVTLLDRRSHHLFTPLLYQVATAALSPGEVAIPIRTLFRRVPNVRTLMAEVSDVDLDAHRLLLATGDSVEYDYLVLAQGARPHFFGKRDQWAPHVDTLESLESALRLRERVLYCFEREELRRSRGQVPKPIRLSILGGGPSGVELAGALAELGRRVIARDYRSIHRQDIVVSLFEAEDRVLPSFNERSSRAARRQLEELGVDLRLRERVEAVSANRVVTTRGAHEADVLCWGSGVEPLSALGGAFPERGIEVDDDCSVSGHPSVFAIGDVARFALDGTALPGLAPVALQQGRFVAQTILAELRGSARKPFQYRDRGLMAVIGRRRAVVETRRLQLDGFFAWLAWVVLHVFYLSGFRNRTFVLLEWLFSYVAARPGAQLITHDAATRQLAAELAAPRPRATSGGLAEPGQPRTGTVRPSS